MGRARYRLHPLSPPGEGRGEGIEQVHASHLKIYHYQRVMVRIQTMIALS